PAYSVHSSPSSPPPFSLNDTTTPEPYPLSLHDALPIWARRRAGRDCSRHRVPFVRQGVFRDGSSPHRRRRQDRGLTAIKGDEHGCPIREGIPVKSRSEEDMMAARLPYLDREQVPPDVQAVYDTMTK